MDDIRKEQESVDDPRKDNSGLIAKELGEW